MDACACVSPNRLFNPSINQSINHAAPPPHPPALEDEEEAEVEEVEQLHPQGLAVRGHLLVSEGVGAVCVFFFGGGMRKSVGVGWNGGWWVFVQRQEGAG